MVSTFALRIAAAISKCDQHCSHDVHKSSQMQLGHFWCPCLLQLVTPPAGMTLESDLRQGWLCELGLRLHQYTVVVQYYCSTTVELYLLGSLWITATNYM